MTSKRPTRTTVAAIAVATLISAVGLRAPPPPAQAGGEAKQDHVAALKQSLQDGKTKIRQYEWTETTIVSMKGEEKSRKQNRCYYAADGTVQKVPVEGGAPAPAAAPAGGGRRRGGGAVKQQIVENKKDEIQEYMQRAATLIQSYVPPDPARIQAAKDAGRITVTPPSGGPARLSIADYLQPGDSLTIDLDPVASRLVGLGVNSYLDKPEDPVTLAVQMATLPDGALYAAQTTLDATAKKIRVVIQNSGYRPAAR